MLSDVNLYKYTCDRCMIYDTKTIEINFKYFKSWSVCITVNFRRTIIFIYPLFSNTGL